MSLKVQVHGGRCCGIKSIHGFHGAPTWNVEPKKSQKFINETDIYGRSVSSGYNWYRSKRPKETYLERFEEYIQYIKENRPAGLIEITMTQAQLDGSDYDDDCYENVEIAWEPVLLKHGFKQVSRFFNSNSYNDVYVYHLVYNTKE